VSLFLTFTEFINTDGAFNVTRVDILDEPVDGFNFNATITVRNPSPYIVELVCPFLLTDNTMTIINTFRGM
jgi:hypothetical protein